jgi:NADH-quinone oxidoreductase subunit J
MTEPISAYCRLLGAAGETPLSESVAAAAGAPPTGAVILVLCVLAGLATALLLPSRRESAVARLGGAGLLAVGLIFAGLLVRWTIDVGGMSVYFWAFSAIALFASVRVITHTKPVYSALYFVLTVFATAGLFVLLWAEFMAAALVLIYAGAILITYVFVIMLASEATSAGVNKAEANPLAEHDAVSRSPLAASIIGFAVAGLLVFLVLDKSADLAKPSAVETGIGPIAVLDAGGGFTTPANMRSVNASPDEPAHALNLNESHDGVGADRATYDKIANLGSTQALGQELLENHAINLQLAAVILTLAMVGAITLARRRVTGAAPAGGTEVVHTPSTPVDDNPHSIPVYGTTNPRHKAYPEN